MTSPIAGLGGRRRMLLIAAALTVVVLGVAIMVAVRSSGPDEGAKASDVQSPSSSPTTSASSIPAAKTKSLARFAGAGNKTTKPFGAAANWQIEWRTKDPKFTVELFDRNGKSRGDVVAAKRRTHGSTFVSERGQFELKVTASRDWSIRIIGRALHK
jgi:hypothetical protein